MLLNTYQNHPEAKSLGPDGRQCDSDTRGLLQRAHIIANWPPVYIGKESDKHLEEGEDSKSQTELTSLVVKIQTTEGQLKREQSELVTSEAKLDQAQGDLAKAQADLKNVTAFPVSKHMAAVISNEIAIFVGLPRKQFRRFHCISVNENRSSI